MGSDTGGRSFGALRLVARVANETSTNPGHKVDKTDTVDDSALVTAVQAGQVGVASDLCDRLSPQVTRTVRRLLGRFDSDREDLAQISMIEIVNTIGRYRGECSLDRWAQTVTAHVVFKHIRRRNIERRLFSELLADDAHAAPIQIERMSMSRQLLGRIAAHLDVMDAARVWAFLLHDVMGYDLHEIADMTGTSVAAAQSRLSRGRRELHERAGQDPDLIDLLNKAGQRHAGPASGNGEGVEG
jgi:RNA polymerase sigma-70 factor, ECF subfamily